MRGAAKLGSAIEGYAAEEGQATTGASRLPLSVSSFSDDNGCRPHWSFSQSSRQSRLSQHGQAEAAAGQIAVTSARFGRE